MVPLLLRRVAAVRAHGAELLQAALETAHLTHVVSSRARHARLDGVLMFFQRLQLHVAGVAQLLALGFLLLELSLQLHRFNLFCSYYFFIRSLRLRSRRRLSQTFSVHKFTTGGCINP